MQATHDGDVARCRVSIPAASVQASVHPTLSLSVSGHVDAHLRFFDLKSATCVNVVKAHRDVVTSVQCDPHGKHGSRDQGSGRRGQSTHTRRGI